MIVRARWSQFGNADNMKDTCIQVYKDGHFRLEKVIGFSRYERPDVYESTLSETQMNELLSIIRQEDFAGLYTQSQSNVG